MEAAHMDTEAPLPKRESKVYPSAARSVGSSTSGQTGLQWDQVKLSGARTI